MSVNFARILPVIFTILVTSAYAQKTMTAREVANAMSSEMSCSSSIEDNTCLSTNLISVEEWQSISTLKKAVTSLLANDSLCDEVCNGECGPFYYYASNFNVMPAQGSKADFAHVSTNDISTFDFSSVGPFWSRKILYSLLA